MQDTTDKDPHGASGTSPARGKKRKPRSTMEILIASGKIDPMISQTEFAQALGINASTLRRKIDLGQIRPGTRVTEGRVAWPASYIGEVLAGIRDGKAIA